MTFWEFAAQHAVVTLLCVIVIAVTVDNIAVNLAKALIAWAERREKPDKKEPPHVDP